MLFYKPKSKDESRALTWIQKLINSIHPSNIHLSVFKQLDDWLCAIDGYRMQAIKLIVSKNDSKIKPINTIGINMNVQEYDDNVMSDNTYPNLRDLSTPNDNISQIVLNSSYLKDMVDKLPSDTKVVIRLYDDPSINVEFIILSEPIRYGQIAQITIDRDFMIDTPYGLKQIYANKQKLD